MSNDLDFVILKLQSELENRGLTVQKNKDKIFNTHKQFF